MAKQVEKVALSKGKAFFNLTGTAKVNDYTFKLNEVSEKTGYKYSRLNLGVETSAGNVVYTELMGGFFPSKENVIYVASKEDIKNSYTIDWADRNDAKVLETIHASKFIRVGIEKMVDPDNKDKEKTFVKRFLSAYDAIAYISEHITEGMTISVRGTLKYATYNDKVQIKKEITSIFLAKEDEPFKANFVQTILLDKDSVEKLDPETQEFPISARVVDYVKMWGTKEVKTNVPYYMNYTIKQENSTMSADQVKKFLTKYFKVKKGITEFAVEGDIIEGTQMGEVTEDDIPDDMQELIDLGLYTKEEILGKMVVRGDKVSKFVITKPYVQQIDNNGEKRIQIFFSEAKYTDADLVFDFMYETDAETEVEKPKADTKSSEDDSDAWLKELGGSDSVDDEG